MVSLQLPSPAAGVTRRRTLLAEDLETETETENGSLKMNSKSAMSASAAAVYFSLPPLRHRKL